MSYTEEITEEIVAEYELDPTRETVLAIAERLGKSSRSVTSKLSSLGVYRTQAKTTKSGEVIIRKDQLVADINKWLGIDVPSLTKALKPDLRQLHEALGSLLKEIE